MSKRRTYRATFDDGPNGWFGWQSNAAGPKPLEHGDSCVIARSPWWIDYNHAPPGGGYLHLLFCTLTKGPGIPEHHLDVAGENSLIEGDFPSNYTDAEITVRLRGELETRGANLCLLVQARVGTATSAWILTGQPIRIEREFTKQAITCVPDESQWTSLGARHDRTRTYGHAPLRSVLADVNCDIILVLFPLTIRPMGPIDGDPHLLRPGRDYPVWASHLPEGYVMLDEIRIDFSQAP